METPTTETPTTQEKAQLDLFDYGKKSITSRTVARQKWDMMALDTRDQEKLAWALQNHFEPFGVTTEPRQSQLAGQIEIVKMIWFKRPAHSNEKEMNVPWAGKTEAKKPTIITKENSGHA